MPFIMQQALLEMISSLEFLSLPSGQASVFDVTIGTPFDQANYTIESNGEEIATGTTTFSNPAVVRVGQHISGHHQWIFRPNERNKSSCNWPIFHLCSSGSEIQ